VRQYNKKMKLPSNIFIRIAISLSTLIVYAVMLVVLFPLAGSSITYLAIIPIVVAAWFLGVGGSLVFGIIIILLNDFFIFFIGPPFVPTNTAPPASPLGVGPFGGMAVSDGLTALVFLLVGLTIAWIRKLTDRLHQQAEELQKKHSVLQEEMERRITAEERLVHEALHDPLTILPNRRLFINRLEHAIEWNKRHPDELFALIYLDFDRFKVVNDSLGHTVGDQLLIELARRLKSCTRTVDTVARMGGDEFAILLETVGSEEVVGKAIKRIQESLVAPFEVHGNSIIMTASIGVVMNLHPYEQIGDIIRDADIAMYSAKVGGKNNYKVFDVAMRDQADNILKLESGLRHALQHKEFRIHYQPIFSLKSQRLIGFEALLRWKHPERGLVYPADFMKIAEESGLIVSIGQWVLQEACHQMKQWQMQFDIKPSLTISVNLSSRQFAQPNLTNQIEEVLRQTDLSAESLVLEITETTLIDEIELAVAKIEQLHILGVGIEIDDFGSGYSAMGYLRNLPVNILKIDRSFISTLGVTKSGGPIIQAMIAMANSLDIKVIAEGIETEDQLNNLRVLKCDYGQGFLFNKALESHAAQEMIKKTFLKPRD